MHIEQAQPSEAATVAAVLSEAAQWLATEGRPLWSAADVALERIRRDTEAGRYFIAHEGFGFALHSVIGRGVPSFARYELPARPPGC